MTGTDFRQLLDADPFEPFTVSLTGRSSYTIDRPELAVVTPDGGCIKLLRPAGSWVATLSLDHVVSITFITPTAVR